MRNPPLQSVQPLPPRPTPVTDFNPPVGNQSNEVYQTTNVRKFILLSLILPPIGLLVAWKEKRLHLVLPSLLVAGSLVFGLSNLFLFMSLKPVLSFLKVGTSNLSLVDPLFGTLVLTILLLFGVGISSGFYYKNEVKKEGQLRPKITGILLIIFFTQYIFGFILLWYVNSLILPSFQSQYQDLQETEKNLYP